LNIGKRRRNLRPVRAAIWVIISVLGAAAFAVLAIMIIRLAVVALIVVNARRA